MQRADGLDAPHAIREVVMKSASVAKFQQVLTGHLPLKNAVLCVDCNNISLANQKCPACSSGALMNLSMVLNPNERIQLPAAAHVVPVAA
jgi:hypothetical protein